MNLIKHLSIIGALLLFVNCRSRNAENLRLNETNTTKRSLSIEKIQSSEENFELYSPTGEATFKSMVEIGPSTYETDIESFAEYYIKVDTGNSGHDCLKPDLSIGPCDSSTPDGIFSFVLLEPAKNFKVRKRGLVSAYLMKDGKCLQKHRDKNEQDITSASYDSRYSPYFINTNTMDKGDIDMMLISPYTFKDCKFDIKGSNPADNDTVTADSRELFTIAKKDGKLVLHSAQRSAWCRDKGLLILDESSYLYEEKPLQNMMYNMFNGKPSARVFNTLVKDCNYDNKSATTRLGSEFKFELFRDEIQLKK